MINEEKKEINGNSIIESLSEYLNNYHLFNRITNLFDDIINEIKDEIFIRDERIYRDTGGLCRGLIEGLIKQFKVYKESKATFGRLLIDTKKRKIELSIIKNTHQNFLQEENKLKNIAGKIAMVFGQLRSTIDIYLQLSEENTTLTVEQEEVYDEIDKLGLLVCKIPVMGYLKSAKYKFIF